jgi:hypothetical protein
LMMFVTWRTKGMGDSFLFRRQNDCISEEGIWRVCGPQQKISFANLSSWQTIRVNEL